MPSASNAPAVLCNTGWPAFARVQTEPSEEVAMKIAGADPSSAVPEYHITYVEPTFATVGSSTSSLSPTVAAVGARTGSVSYTHLRAHETPEHLVCRLL